MINEIIIKGSEDTTFHNISFSTSGMNLMISGGQYYQNGQVLFSDSQGGSVTIPTTENMTYEISLLTNGEINVFQYHEIEDAISFYQANPILDLLAWFTVGQGVTTLDNVTINVKKMVTE
jgi:hypothetical protein